MRNFFHGWRRKLGCVTLVMALALMVGWMRSRVVQDGLALNCSEDGFYSVASLDETLNLVRANYAYKAPGQPFIQWFSVPRPANSQNITEMPDMKWRWRATGFGVGDLALTEVDFTILTVPYWFPTGILTIFSAWLLLFKPRPRPQPTTEPGP
ncbi:MAG: hypothetical protein JWP89_4149 [Schlesneria sp.]|nr:hypothetical protein [Schlesneria sp.]